MYKAGIVIGLIIVLILLYFSFTYYLKGYREPDYFKDSGIDKYLPKVSQNEGYDVKIFKQTYNLSNNETPEVLAIYNTIDIYENPLSTLLVSQYDESARKWNIIYNNEFDLEALHFEGRLPCSEGLEAAVISCAFKGDGTTISAMILSYEEDNILCSFLNPNRITNGILEIDEKNNLLIFKDIEGAAEEKYLWKSGSFEPIAP